MGTKLLMVVWMFQEFANKGWCFRSPDFRSAWLPFSAQSGTSSEMDVEHGLGVVPDIVEVLVKAIDGENKDYIFKAMGHAGKDDDANHIYGGVIYLYNEQYVKVIAPNKNNHHDTGGVIYTGETEYWTGINYQFSLDAHIQVRCWTANALPTPSYHISGTEIQSGSNAGSKSYIEINHTLLHYPDLVKVRALMTGVDLAGWYCDAQGSVTGQFSLIRNYGLQGGIHFGYSNSTVRVWASSYGNDVLCGLGDGWGAVMLDSNTGVLEVMAWSDMGLRTVYEQTVSLDTSSGVDDLEIVLPQALVDIDNALFSFMVRVESGPNEGFLFEGIGSAKSSVYDINTSPCDYGGIIYAYSNTSVRLWKPSPAHSGASVCISEGYGEGQNTQGAHEVIVMIVARQWDVLQSASGPESSTSFYCGHFYRVGEDTSYIGTALSQTYSSSQTDCWKICHSDYSCTTFTFADNTCKLYELFQSDFIVLEAGSELWTRQV